MTIKIFAVSDVEWYAAETAEAAMSAYAMTCDYDIEEISQIRDEGYPVEIEDCELDTKTIRVETDEIDTVNGYPIEEVVSWRHELQRMIAAGTTFPCSFACSEY